MSDKYMDNLVTIFQLRALLLREMNPRFYAQNADIILRSSMAAQDYVMSGTYGKEYTAPVGRQGTTCTRHRCRRPSSWGRPF